MNPINRRDILLARKRRRSLKGTVSMLKPRKGENIRSSAHGRFVLVGGAIPFYGLKIRLTEEKITEPEYIDPVMGSDMEDARPLYAAPENSDAFADDETEDQTSRFERDYDTGRRIEEYNERIKQLSFHMIMSGAIALFLTFIELLPLFTLNVPDMFSPDRAPIPYLLQNLLLTLPCAALSFRIIRGGIKSTIDKKLDGDSVFSVAVVLALAQMLFELIWCVFVSRGPVGRVFGSAVCFSLFLNDLGLLFLTQRRAMNFRFTALHGQRTAALNVDNISPLGELIRAGTSRGENIVYGASAKQLSGYDKYASEEDFCEHFMNRLSPYVLAAAAVAGVIGGLASVSVWGGMRAMCAVLILGAPVCRLICLNLPMKVTSRRLLRLGIMLNGWAAVDEFGSTNTVAVSAESLFPQGSVRLTKVKRVGDMPIDRTMRYAGALVTAGGGPLVQIFSELLDNRSGALPEAEGVMFESERGMSGYVESRPVLVGTRELLEKHGCETPSRDYEQLMTKGDECSRAVYVAVSGQLCAVMVVEYFAGNTQIAALKRLFDNSIAIIVYTCDPNVTSRLITDVFGVPKRTVTILDAKSGKVYDQLTHITRPFAPALLATSGKFPAFTLGVSECVRLKRVLTASALVNAAVYAVGILLMVLLGCLGAREVTPAKVLMLQLVYAVVSFIPALISL